MPIQSTATANGDLIAVFHDYIIDPAGMVADKIAPPFQTKQVNGRYYVFKKDNQLSIPDLIKHAPGTDYQRTVTTLSDDAYICDEFGIEHVLANSEIAKYADLFSAEDSSIRRISDIIKVNRERRVHTKATTVTQTASPTVKWNAYTTTNHNPIADIKAGKAVIRSACGFYPNTITMSDTVWNTLAESPVLKEAVKYSAIGIITPEVFARLVGIPNVLVAGVTQNTAADGQTVSASEIWGEDVLLSFSQPSASLDTPNWMRTFIWDRMTGPNGLQLEDYESKEKNGRVFRGSQWVNEKITGASMAYYLSNVLA